MFGAMPSYGFFLRHVSGLEMNHVKVGYVKPEARPAFVLADVQGAQLDHIEAQRGDAGAFALRHVSDFTLTESPGVPDSRAVAAELRTL